MIHVIPLNDERQHATASDCWCEPRLDFVDPETNLLWASGDGRAIHNAADCREVCEEITGECVEEGREWILMNSDGDLIDMGA